MVGRSRTLQHHPMLKYPCMHCFNPCLLRAGAEGQAEVREDLIQELRNHVYDTNGTNSSKLDQAHACLNVLEQLTLEGEWGGRG